MCTRWLSRIERSEIRTETTCLIQTISFQVTGGFDMSRKEHAGLLNHRYSRKIVSYRSILCYDERHLCRRLILPLSVA